MDTTDKDKIYFRHLGDLIDEIKRSSNCLAKLVESAATQYQQINENTRKIPEKVE